MNNDFTVRKVMTLPDSGIPNCLYIKPLSDAYCSARMTNKDGSVAHKLMCGGRDAVHSQLVIDGPQAAKFSTNVLLTLTNSDPRITSYSVSVNNGPLLLITDDEFSLHMSDTPGDIMALEFFPQDDQGTKYQPVPYSVLTTAGPPIDSGLTVSGPFVVEQDRSIDLEIDDYIVELDRIGYTVGLASEQLIDPAQLPPKTITISPKGAIGQMIPVTFYPKTDDYNEYLPVTHMVEIIAKIPRDSGTTISGTGTTPQNREYPFNVNSTLTDIEGYVITIDTVPTTYYEADSVPTDILYDPKDIPVGTTLTVTVTPNDGTDQPYIPVTHTIEITAPISINSTVTVSGPSFINSNEEYTLGITNTDPDIQSYHIVWDGIDYGIIDGDPDQWVLDNVPTEGEKAIIVEITPLSETNMLYNTITKTINVGYRLPEPAKLNFSNPSMVYQNDPMDIEVDTTYIHPKVIGTKVFINGRLMATIPSAGTEYTIPHMGYPVGDIVTVTYQPFSDDPNYNFLPVETEVRILEPLVRDSGITVYYSEYVLTGSKNKYTWSYAANPDVEAMRIWFDGELMDTMKIGEWYTPNSSNLIDTVHEVYFEPVSSTGVLYTKLHLDYVTYNDSNRIDSGLRITGADFVNQPDAVTLTLSGGPLPSNVTGISVYLNGVYVETIPANSTSYTFESNDGIVDQVNNIRFLPIVSSGQEYIFADHDILVEPVLGIDSIYLNKTGVSTTVPYGTVPWTFDITDHVIDVVDVWGDEIVTRTGVNPNNVNIQINTDVVLGTTIQVCARGYEVGTGLVTVPDKCWPLTVNNFTTNEPNITDPVCDTTMYVDGSLSWNAPVVSPDSFDSIVQYVEVSSSSTFSSIQHSYNFPVTEGTAPVKQLPQTAGTLNINSVIPAGVWYFRSRYGIVETGTTYYGAWSNTCKLTLEDRPNLSLTKTGPSSTVPYGTETWDWSLIGGTIDQVTYYGPQIDNYTGVSPTGTTIHVNTNVTLGTTIQICAIGHDSVSGDWSTEFCFPLTINNFTTNTPAITGPACNSEQSAGVTLNWNAPIVSPDSYDSILQFVEVSENVDFNIGPVHTFNFTAVEGTASVHALPTSVGELSLNSLIPEDGDIWIRSRFGIVETGTTYYGAYGTVCKYTLVAQSIRAPMALCDPDVVIPPATPIGNNSTVTTPYTTPKDYEIFFDGKMMLGYVNWWFGSYSTWYCQRSSTSGPLSSLEDARAYSDWGPLTLYGIFWSNTGDQWTHVSDRVWDAVRGSSEVRVFDKTTYPPTLVANNATIPPAIYDDVDREVTSMGMHCVNQATTQDAVARWEPLAKASKIFNVYIYDLNATKTGSVAVKMLSNSTYEIADNNAWDTLKRDPFSGIIMHRYTDNSGAGGVYDYEVKSWLHFIDCPTSTAGDSRVIKMLTQNFDHGYVFLYKRHIFECFPTQIKVYDLDPLFPAQGQVANLTSMPAPKFVYTIPTFNYGTPIIDLSSPNVSTRPLRLTCSSYLTVTDPTNIETHILLEINDTVTGINLITHANKPYGLTPFPPLTNYGDMIDTSAVFIPSDNGLELIVWEIDRENYVYRRVQTHWHA